MTRTAWTFGVWLALFLATAPPLAAQTGSDATSAALDAEGTPQSAVRALLVPRVESMLSSQITAQIIGLPLKEGERFKKGDTLVEFRCDETRAELLKSRAELRGASSTYKANVTLRQHNAVSPLEVEVSKARADQARADVELWQARLAYCKIVAPFPGRVSRLVAKAYETVTQGEPLLEILDDRSLTMQLNVPSHWLTWLTAGTGFQVRIDETGKTYSATVTELGAKVDPVSQTLLVNAAIDGQHEELLAGMSGIARFKVPR
jgi:RND family efflux transporter MFP subunit